MDSQKIFSEIQKLTGKTPPISIERNPDGSVSKIEVQKEWQEGSTTPEYKGRGVTRKIINYKPEYKKYSLTKDEIKKVDEYIASVTKKA